jgi:hypothetical protein
VPDSVPWLASRPLGYPFWRVPQPMFSYESLSFARNDAGFATAHKLHRLSGLRVHDPEAEASEAREGHQVRSRFHGCRQPAGRPGPVCQLQRLLSGAGRWQARVPFELIHTKVNPLQIVTCKGATMHVQGSREQDYYETCFRSGYGVCRVLLACRSLPSQYWH